MFLLRHLVSGVAMDLMEQMEQHTVPRPWAAAAQDTCVIRANPMRYSGGEGGGKYKRGICNVTKMCPSSAILTLYLVENFLTFY